MFHVIPIEFQPDVRRPCGDITYYRRREGLKDDGYFYMDDLSMPPMPRDTVDELLLSKETDAYGCKYLVRDGMVYQTCDDSQFINAWKDEREENRLLHAKVLEDVCDKFEGGGSLTAIQVLAITQDWTVDRRYKVKYEVTYVNEMTIWVTRRSCDRGEYDDYMFRVCHVREVL